MARSRTSVTMTRNQRSREVSNQVWHEMWGDSGHFVSAPEEKQQAKPMLNLKRRRWSVYDRNARYCIRATGAGDFWILNRPDNGWGEFGYLYPSFASLLEEWQVVVIDWRLDKTGYYWVARPIITD